MGVTQHVDARSARVTSYSSADFAPPTGREEEWRFTPLDRLRGLLDAADARGSVDTDVDAPQDVRVERVPRGDARLGRSGPPADRAAALAWETFGEALVLTVPRESVAGQPITVTTTGRGLDPASGHTLIDVQPFGEAVIVLEHRGDAVLSETVEVLVGDHAQVTVVSIQEWSPASVHLAHHRIHVGRDARVRHIVVSLGGDLVRIAPTVEYDGPGGDAELIGAYFADAGQHLEHRLFVDHAIPHCRSNVVYKGALQGEGAHTIWIGDVLIRAAAEGTDTYEINRNLVLTDGARADSVPNLEIETGEITGAGHASATGRFDDEQLFYLQSRGITEDDARRLVVRGFFADLVGRIGIPDLEARLMDAVEAELEAVAP